MSGQELFHFIRPLWLAALPLAVLLPWWWRRSRQPSGDWERICDPHLLRWLSHHDGSDARVRSGHWLAGLALAIAALALAGPSWHKLPDSSFSALDARVIVLDLSASMLATDLRPNRLTRARFRLADLLNETQEGQTGLVAFAGDAYAVSPLTTDTNTIANMLPALQPDVIPVRGSRADRGLGMAATLLERAGFTRGEVLLVTDSATARDAARARELRDRGIITSVLAVGTVDGSPIPSGSGFLTDRGGNVIITSLDMASLQAVSQAGGGKFSELETVTAGLEPWAAGEGSEFTRREDALGQRWQDSGPWLVLLLLPLALIGFRRGVLFLLPLGLLPALLHVPEAQAGWWADAWQRRDQQAWQALKTEDNERAAALANDPDISGEAWYRSGKYDSALAAWAKRQTADAEYNKGNTLAQLGDYAGALNAYERALEMEPGMEDARFNRELVEQLQQQQEQQQKDQQGDSQAGESQEGESSDLASQGDTSEQADGQSPDEGEPGEQQEGEQESEQGEGEQGGKHGNQTNYAESWSAEDAQAMEQWLRRIPDDPGGLLRRKFINEHQRRGAPKDEPEPW
ncbi:MAG TPA: VWA domain-containing protein [Xanthomonadales bacterium]|nr:VWA domain-containing protein [Xanthomonadales bacterium]